MVLSLSTAMAAVIGLDERTERAHRNLPVHIEAAQGRICCHHRGPTPAKNQPPSKDHLRKNYAVANTFLAFEDDMAIVNRHTLVNARGKPWQKLENCFFEHIQSGELIPLVDSAFPPLEPGSNVEGTDQLSLKGRKNDMAVVRLSRKPTGGMAIREKDMHFGGLTDPSQRLKVISNYAKNRSNRESLTMTTCNPMGQYAAEGVPINVHPTDCDTGEGSSGAQVYIESPSGLKLTGIVTGERKDVPEGGQHDPKKLTTAIVTFNENLLESYRTLKSRRDI